MRRVSASYRRIPFPLCCYIIATTLLRSLSVGMKRPRCFCRSRWLSLRLQAALQESGLSRSTMPEGNHQSELPDSPPHSPHRRDKNTENERQRRSRAPSPN
ncbi:hypothetical protein BJX99DRAFT_265998 [Aspergillus californicus]